MWTICPRLRKRRLRREQRTCPGRIISAHCADNIWSRRGKREQSSTSSRQGRAEDAASSCYQSKDALQNARAYAQYQARSAEPVVLHSDWTGSSIEPDAAHKKTRSWSAWWQKEHNRRGSCVCCRMAHERASVQFPQQSTRLLHVGNIRCIWVYYTRHSV